MSQRTERDSFPHPRELGIDLTAEARKRVLWPKVGLVGSLRTAYTEMISLYRDFGKHKVDALVPWQLFDYPDDLAERFSIETHLLRVLASDMIYIVNPGGYIGANTTLDIGAAVGKGKPTYSMEKLSDRGIAMTIDGIKTPAEIISLASQYKGKSGQKGIYRKTA